MLAGGVYGRASPASNQLERSLDRGSHHGDVDQTVDDYGTWGRNAASDGYDSTWTLNVNQVPEPSTALLMMLGLAGLGWSSSRR